MRKNPKKGNPNLFNHSAEGWGGGTQPTLFVLSCADGNFDEAL